MLKLDLTNIVTKSRKRKSRKAKEKGALALGDWNRIKHLPKEVGTGFPEAYGESLEAILYPYVVEQAVSLYYAAQYRDVFVDMVLGSRKHFGIFHYLKEKDDLKLKDLEIIQKAEELIVKGWRVSEEDGRYWLLGAEGNRIIDLTGESPLFKEVGSVAFDSDTAHVFFPTQAASVVARVSNELGFDADELAAQGNMGILLEHLGDSKFSGYIVNYLKLRTILKKEHYYTTNSPEGVSVSEIFKSGYRLSSNIVANESAVLERDGVDYLLHPVTSGMTEGVPDDLLGYLAYRVKRVLSPRVAMPTIVEVKDFNKSFAFLAEMYPDEYMGSTFSESYNIIHTLENRSVLAELTALETVLLGNPYYGPGSFVVDGISKKVYSHHHNDYFKRKFVVPSIGIGDLQEFGDDVVTELVKEVPEGFKNRLTSFEFNFPEYPYDLSFAKQWFEDGKEVVL